MCFQLLIRFLEKNYCGKYESSQREFATHKRKKYFVKNYSKKLLIYILNWWLKVLNIIGNVLNIQFQRDLFIVSEKFVEIYVTSTVMRCHLLIGIQTTGMTCRRKSGALLTSIHYQAKGSYTKYVCANTFLFSKLHCIEKWVNLYSRLFILWKAINIIIEYRSGVGVTTGIRRFWDYYLSITSQDDQLIRKKYENPWTRIQNYNEIFTSRRFFFSIKTCICVTVLTSKVDLVMTYVGE